MKNIKISMGNNWPLEKQTPNRMAEWGEYKFFINDNTEECDYWFVLYDIEKPIKGICNPKNVFFICGEPEDICVYKRRFVEQFGGLITTQSVEYDVLKVIRKTILPWMIGARFIDGKMADVQSKDYDELMRNFGEVKKTKLISVISSDKNFTEGHRKRQQFVGFLKEEFKDNIDVFGRGIRDFEDKWEVIAPYKYHVALENCQVRDYITEKLTDAYLSEAYPIYWGCPNVDEYYPSDSLTVIDIEQPQLAADIIKKVIEGNYYEKYRADILKGKKLVLDKYNVFPELANIMDELSRAEVKGEKKKITIYPNGDCNFLWDVKKRMGIID
ncbi:glycosyltransferase family 10 domain-containing protein [Selenomonas sp. FC4001]|uniref:glycosyltransferase family 10 domain-containing protein n=1 Tax=Selenomonas sp. FC4001 TaxID=1408313 RepID=UPI00055E29C0|nr:glycosyltransferase family 10 [Selenomonas sp. FC4001]